MLLNVFYDSLVGEVTMFGSVRLQFSPANRLNNTCAVPTNDIHFLPFNSNRFFALHVPNEPNNCRFMIITMYQEKKDEKSVSFQTAHHQNYLKRKIKPEKSLDVQCFSGKKRNETGKTMSTRSYKTKTY